MNKNVQKPVRYGNPSGARVVNPAGAGQLGAHLGTHHDRGNAKGNPASPLYGGAVGGGINVKLGNQVAGNVGPGGCGTGRTVYARGTQSQHGPAVQGNPPALSGIGGKWGDMPSKGGRR